MTGRHSSRPPREWVGWAGFVIVVAGIVWQGGGMSSQIQRNTNDIAALRASDAARSDSLNAINVRTARIEAKLDVALPMPRESAP